MFSQARLPEEVDIDPLMQKDSMDITSEDRQLIFDHCMLSAGDRILVTHGTDTMSETAIFLGKKVVGEKQ